MYPYRDKVTVTHIPTGISATSNAFRTDWENRRAAEKLLRARLWRIFSLEIKDSDLCVETILMED